MICDRLVYLKHIQKIDLSQNRITDLSIDNGLSTLMSSKVHPPFTEMVLNSNQITGEGAQLLFESLAECKTIQHVNLADNRVNDEFVIWL